MSNGELNTISEKVEKTEQAIVWFIRNVLRGTWFRRLVFLLVVFAILARPAVIALAPSFLIGTLPSWYEGFYWAVVGLLLLTSVIVGVKAVPRLLPPPKPQIDARAVRGLLPFNLEDSKLFAQLERGVELQRVLASLRDQGFRFGILVGTSGSGKTSFMRAGLLAQLREDKVPATYVELSNEDPLVSIQREVVRQQGDGMTAGVLLLDQFEQFFLHRRNAHERKPLIDALAGWYQRDSAVRVLVSIRAEDAWQMIEIQQSLDYQLSTRNYFKLPKFSIEQSVEVLRVLCNLAGIAFDEGFAHKIADQELRDPEDGLVSPVNLGIVVLVLATGRQAFTQESFKAYRGIEGLLEVWLDSQLEAAKSHGMDKAAIRTLTTLCDFDTDHRAGILTIDSIANKLAGDLTRDQVERAIKWLVSPDVRLVVAAGEGATGYQLSHERLVRAVRKVAGKLLDDAARANQLLDRRVSEWVGNDRSSRFLLSLFEYWRIERQRRYLILGETRADKEKLLKRSRMRWLRVAALAVLGVILLLVSYAGWTSNAVQRRYIRKEFASVSASHPSEDVASALAVIGNLAGAREMIDKMADEEEERGRAFGKIALVMTRTALDRQDRALLGQAKQVVDELSPESCSCSDSLQEIVSETSKAGLSRHDQELLSLAQGMIERLEREEKSKAICELAVEMAKAGEAVKARVLLDQAQTLTGSIPSNAVGDIAVAIGKVAGISKDQTLLLRAQKLSEKLDQNDRPEVMERIAKEIGKSGWFDQSQTIAETLEPDLRLSVLREVAVEMAKLGKLNKDQKLLDQAQELAKNLDWKDASIERAKLAALLGDDDSALALFHDAYDELARPQGGVPSNDVLRIPKEMAELGLAIRDVKLLEGARQQALDTYSPWRSEALRTLASQMTTAGDVPKARDLLEEAWQEAQKLRSSEYYIALKDIAGDMAKLGHLKRAREIAESASGSAQGADALAAVVIAEASGSQL